MIIMQDLNRLLTFGTYVFFLEERHNTSLSYVGTLFSDSRSQEPVLLMET